MLIFLSLSIYIYIYLSLSLSISLSLYIYIYIYIPTHICLLFLLVFLLNGTILGVTLEQGGKRNKSYAQTFSRCAVFLESPAIYRPAEDGMCHISMVTSYFSPPKTSI